MNYNMLLDGNNGDFNNPLIEPSDYRMDQLVELLDDPALPDYQRKNAYALLRILQGCSYSKTSISFSLKKSWLRILVRRFKSKGVCVVTDELTWE